MRKTDSDWAPSPCRGWAALLYLYHYNFTACHSSLPVPGHALRVTQAEHHLLVHVDYKFHFSPPPASTHEQHDLFLGALLHIYLYTWTCGYSARIQPLLSKTGGGWLTAFECRQNRLLSK